MDIEAFKRALDSKADASAVLVKLAQDSAIIEAKIGMLNEGLTDLKKLLDNKAGTVPVQAKFVEDATIIEAKFA